MDDYLGGFFINTKNFMNSKVLSKLGSISIQQFLDEYWQKKPLLIRQAFTDFESLISANELAGLAMEDFVESRIIKTKNWELQHGPFSEEQLTNLPSKDWTLLVQGLDQLIPEFSELLQAFRFIPSWRLDDIMVSFAADGGSVGPHFDHYDVFLLQGEGKRRWQLGECIDEGVELEKDTPLSIIKNFNTEHEWTLEPGDMLYVPPKFSHWGIAEGECLTYSIGFRAPDQEEILSHFCDYSLRSIRAAKRFKDENLSVNDKNYEISDKTINQIRSLLLETIDKPALLSEWFGRYMTIPRYESLEEELKECDFEKLEEDAVISRSLGVRLAFKEDNDKGKVRFFVNGDVWLISKPLVEFLCENSSFTIEKVKQKLFSDTDKAAFQSLIEKNYFVISEA